MAKILSIITLLALSLSAVEIPMAQTEIRNFSKSIELNSKIIQLSNAKQSIMSVLGGHIEKYYVKIGQNVKAGDKIVLIDSIELSKMTAKYIATKKQLATQENNYQASKTLYKKGMTSRRELNQQSIAKDELLSTLNSLKSQLSSLSINADSLKSAKSNFVLYAHSDGRVSEILQSLHTSIKDDTPIISLVKNQAYYLKSFLPLEYASEVKIGQKLMLSFNGKALSSHITQILPKLDEATQRIVVLSSIDETPEKLFINTYIESKLYFSSLSSHVSVLNSALSFFNNEWVIFVKNKHLAIEGEEHPAHENDGLDDEHEGHNEHEGHGHEEEGEHGKHGHDEESEEEAEYVIRVVKILDKDDKYTAIEGLDAGEEYVSAKSYYVKSLLLKSSLGEHGH